MIAVWLAFAVVALLVLLYLAPSFFGPLQSDEDAEVDTYFAQIDTIKTDGDMSDEESAQAVASLQRQILAKQEDATEQGASPRLAALVCLGVLLIGGLTYHSQSTPLGAQPTTPESPLASVPANIDDQTRQIEALIAQLEERLATDRAEDPAGWTIYARSLITLERYDDALQAYERALSLSESDSDLTDEVERARAFIAARRSLNAGTLDPRPLVGPSAADVEAAQSLNPDEQKAMIEAMVTGLADRLDADPDDPAGWARLIRARIVMGQIDDARADVERVRAIFAADDKVVEDILLSAGWSE